MIFLFLFYACANRWVLIGPLADSNLRILHQLRVPETNKVTSESVRKQCERVQGQASIRIRFRLCFGVGVGVGVGVSVPYNSVGRWAVAWRARLASMKIMLLHFLHVKNGLR